MYLTFSFSQLTVLPKIINIEFAVLCSFVQPDPLMVCYSDKFEDTKGVIRRHKSKKYRHKQDKITNKLLLSTTKKTKDCATQTQEINMFKLLTVVIYT
jgi:hypothetical protein